MNNPTTKMTMRQLLASRAELEPDLCEEFKKVFTIGTAEGYNKRVPLDDLSDFDSAWIQWAVQEAIVSRGWRFNLYGSGLGFVAEMRNERAEGANPAEALLSAYLQALVFDKTGR